MKKIIALVLSISMLFVMTSCSIPFLSEDADSNKLSELENPIVACSSAEELLEMTGISLDAPKKATDVYYSYINSSGENGLEYLAQVEFNYDDNNYCYRAQETSETTLYEAALYDVNASSDDLSKSMENTVNACGEFAGLYDDWSASASIDVKNRDGVVAFNKGKSGFVAWLDVAPGVIYSLSMTENSSQDLLMKMAEKCFKPMQGDAK